MTASVAVLGAGAFGTALAIALSRKMPTLLWARDPAHVARMEQERENAVRLPAAPFPEMLRLSRDLGDVAACKVLLIAVPMQRLRAFLSDHGDRLRDHDLLLCCKGIEIETGLGPVEVARAVMAGREPALLTGPSFAADIAAGLPTALTLACAQDARGAQLQALLSTQTLRLYRTQDVTGAEVGGALKNVIAIACGAVIGAGYGDSARAALMTRGYAEMQRLALHRGAQPATLAGLCGFGDLALTCTSDLSRNFRLGLALGRGETFDPTITVEGAATARATAHFASRSELDMPITQTVTNLLDQRLTIGDAADQLLKRPLKEE